MKHWITAISTLCTLACAYPSAFAAQTSGSGVLTTPQQTESAVPSPSPSHQFEVKSSVQVSRETLREAYQASHDAYTKKLQKYAKCSEADARKAVLGEHPGAKIEEIQLRNIRTNLVYMAIARDDEDKYLVIVDAGNANILMDRRIPTHHERVFANGPDGGRAE
ncbi:hypothetical protein Heshes_04240 [Alicyclobacillus hesperidum]|uniref:Peptidase propeptide and YPEB domain-containing protein n=1 Tax=Alicyclobacillus hesperidum TaxID=89784 RepID=A0A1H2QBQ8_9BACL|nr:hypothetical protein [Alicyclobacillus hesperidum]GLV12740.1 hypothetical protein Heshes_04240 [Alicyclobacillus hesperidum]SDW03859.1 hypothetical protein SAMN04489725_101159 [Alicyclobacillus hesperidum]